MVSDQCLTGRLSRFFNELDYGGSLIAWTLEILECRVLCSRWIFDHKVVDGKVENSLRDVLHLGLRIGVLG